MKPKPKTKPKVKQGLMTGEVSRMLGISRSMVIKFFEQRILTGWKHPLASWRVIDRESVEALVKKPGIQFSMGMENWPPRGKPRKGSKPSDGMALEPKKVQGLTTGKVSRMLGGIISQRTVMRLFDKGVFTGWTDPMTGMRMIDPKSVEALERKGGLATGEASKMLGISVYMAVRLFDQGVLTGWKNPATGWRMIDRESVEALAKKGMEAWPRKGRPRKTWAVVQVKQKEG